MASIESLPPPRSERRFMDDDGSSVMSDMPGTRQRSWQMSSSVASSAYSGETPQRSAAYGESALSRPARNRRGSDESGRSGSAAGGNILHAPGKFVEEPDDMGTVITTTASVTSSVMSERRHKRRSRRDSSASSTIGGRVAGRNLGSSVSGSDASSAVSRRRRSSQVGAEGRAAGVSKVHPGYPSRRASLGEDPDAPDSDDDTRSYVSARSQRTTNSRRSSRSSRSRRSGSGSERTSYGTNRKVINPNRQKRRGQQLHAAVGEEGINKLSLRGDVERSDAVGGATKRLDARVFEHDEERDEFRNLEYTPITTRRPVDMSYPLRLRRMMDVRAEQEWERDRGLPNALPEEEMIQAPEALEILVCVTVSGQDKRQLHDTLSSLAGSLHYLETRTEINWTELAVVIMVDGRDTPTDSMMEYLSSELLLFDASLIDLQESGRPTQVHLFERSVEIPRFAMTHEFHPPLQTMLAVKEHRTGQLNSHLWFFTAFCKQLQPTYALMLDCGTTAMPASVARLVLALDRDPHAAIATGNMRVKKPQLFNLWHAAQAFEYRLQGTLEDPLDSLAGFLPHPGDGFAMYRWFAVRGAPLAQYLLAEDLGADVGPLHANAFYQADRLLSMEVVTKKNRRWRTVYESAAIAEQDAPLGMMELLETRKEHLASQHTSDLIYLTDFLPNLCCRARHNPLQRCCFFIQYFLRLIYFVFKYLMLGSMFLAFMILGDIVLQSIPEIGAGLSYVFFASFLLLTFAQVMMGLGSPPDQMVLVYWLSAAAFSFLMMLFIFLSLILFVRDYTIFSAEMRFMVGGLAAIVVLAATLAGNIWAMMLTFIQWTLAFPMYVNMLPIYAMAHTNDATWAIREDRRAEAVARPEELKKIREAEREEARANAEGLKRVVEVDKKGKLVGKVNEGLDQAQLRAAMERANQQAANITGSQAPEEPVAMPPQAAAAAAAAAEATDDDSTVPASSTDGERKEPVGATGEGGRALAAARQAAHAAEVPETVFTAPDEKTDILEQRRMARGGQLPSNSDDSDEEEEEEEGDQVGELVPLRGARPVPGGVGDGAASTVSNTDAASQFSAKSKSSAARRRARQKKKRNVVSMPADVAVVISTCRNQDIQAAQRAVLSALQQEAARVLGVEKDRQKQEKEIRDRFSAFRTKLLAFFLALNFLWVTVILFFGLQQYFAFFMTGGILLLVVIRVFGVLVYTLGLVLDRLCIDCWGTLCCWLFCCRQCGRRCGQLYCVMCLRCAGPADLDPTLQKRRELEDEDDEDDEDASSDEGSDVSGGDESTAVPRPRKSNARRRARASQEDVGDGYDNNMFAANIDDAIAQQLAQMQAMGMDVNAAAASVGMMPGMVPGAPGGMMGPGGVPESGTSAMWMGNPNAAMRPTVFDQQPPLGGDVIAEGEDESGTQVSASGLHQLVPPQGGTSATGSYDVLGGMSPAQPVGRNSIGVRAGPDGGPVMGGGMPGAASLSPEAGGPRMKHAMDPETGEWFLVPDDGGDPDDDESAAGQGYDDGTSLGGESDGHFGVRGPSHEVRRAEPA